MLQAKELAMEQMVLNQIAWPLPKETYPQRVQQIPVYTNALFCFHSSGKSIAEVGALI